MKVELLNRPTFSIDPRKKWLYCTTNPTNYIIEGVEIPDCNVYSGEVFLGYSRSNKLTIRKGYAFDGMTNFPDTPQNLACAMLHDFLYQSALVSRKNADKLLCAAMKEASASHRRLVYLGVRLFGWLHFADEKNNIRIENV